MSDSQTNEQSEKPVFTGTFRENLQGRLKTVNVSSWGIRGIIVTKANEEFIYVIDFERTPKEEIPLLSKNDIINLTKVYVTTYKGKVTTWLGKEQAKLCKNAIIQLLHKAESETNLENNSKPIVANVQHIEVLQRKIEDAAKALHELKNKSSFQTNASIDNKDFIRLALQATLYINRMLATILTILEKE